MSTPDRIRAELKRAAKQAYVALQNAGFTTGQISMAAGLNASVIRKLGSDGDASGWRPPSVTTCAKIDEYCLTRLGWHFDLRRLRTQLDAARATQDEEITSNRIRVGVHGISWQGDGVAQTADVVILTPLADEFDALRAAMRGGEQGTWGSRTIYRGEIAGQRVVVVPILGMGNSRATLAARDAVAVWNPSRLLLVGIAGGAPEGSDDMHLGDVLIPTEVVGYELAKVKPGQTDRRWDVFKPDHDLLLVAQQVQPADWVHSISIPRPDGTGGRVIPRVHVGPVLSGDKVLAENAAVTDLRQHWPKAIGVEMEAVGVALVAYTGGPAFLMIRAASDFADEDKSDDWRRYAAAAAAEFALAVLRRAAPPAERNRPQAARIDAPPSYPGEIKLHVTKNLHDSWEPVADLFEVPPDKQLAFSHSANPGRELWIWLEVRGKLPELPAILDHPDVGRPDLAKRMREAGTR